MAFLTIGNQLIDLITSRIGWVIVLAMANGVMSYILAKMVYNISRTTCMRSRIHAWLKHKFDSWEALMRWVKLTDAYDLDWLAGQPDDSWEPDIVNGGCKGDIVRE